MKCGDEEELRRSREKWQWKEKDEKIKGGERTETSKGRQKSRRWRAGREQRRRFNQFVVHIHHGIRL